MPISKDHRYVSVIFEFWPILAKLPATLCIKAGVSDAASGVRKHASQPRRDAIQFSQTVFASGK